MTTELTTPYTLQINSAGEIEIACGSKHDVIGLAHRIGMPEELPSFAVEMIKNAKANPSEYCFCNGRVVRLSHRYELEKMITDGRAAFAMSPDGLRDARAKIIYAMRYLSEAAEHTRTQNFHNFDNGVGMGLNEYDFKAGIACEKLVVFDAAHPEIKAGIEAEKAAASERNFWN